MLIVVSGPKGGIGKTTAATNLAAMLVHNGRDVHLYDMDALQTASLWASVRDENLEKFGITRVSSSQKVISREIVNVGAVIRNELVSMVPKYQDIVIDAGGTDNEALRAALSLADLAIFPIIPSDFDIWTFGRISNLVAGAQGKEDSLQARILLNKVNTNPATAKTELSMVDDYLRDFDNLSRCSAFLSDRVAIKRASGQGLAIVEYKPSDLKAIDEVNNIYKEVMACLSQSEL